MITLEQVLYVIPLLALSASITYYAITIRHQTKTRQAQLLTRLYETYTNSEFRKNQLEVLQFQFKDYDEFAEKYGFNTNLESYAKWQSVMSFFNGVGVLLKNNMVDINLVDELLVNMVFATWDKMGSVIIEWRKRWNSRKDRIYSNKYPYYHGFEYLFEELKKRDPVLKK
jgi:hypothetical protein